MIGLAKRRRFPRGSTGKVRQGYFDNLLEEIADNCRDVAFVL